MSRFFLGQPVRKARGWSAGLTGIVAAIDESDERGLGVKPDSCGVGFDENDAFLPFANDQIVWGYPSEFEPISDANTVIPFSDCVWKPQHLRSRVEA